MERKYELNTIVDDVQRNGWRRVCHMLNNMSDEHLADFYPALQVALQFPDDMLQISAAIAEWLSERVTSAIFFVVGDTSYVR